MKYWATNYFRLVERWPQDISHRTQGSTLKRTWLPRQTEVSYHQQCRQCTQVDSHKRTWLNFTLFTFKVLPTRPQCTSQEAKPQKPQLVTTRLFDRTLLSSPLPKDKWLWKRWGGVEKMYLYICVFVYLCKSCERGDEELRKWNDSYETLNLQSPSPALHDLPSPDLTSANPVVKRQPQQKFFPAQAKRWWG